MVLDSLQYIKSYVSYQVWVYRRYPYVINEMIITNAWCPKYGLCDDRELVMVLV